MVKESEEFAANAEDKLIHKKKTRPQKSDGSESPSWDKTSSKQKLISRELK